MGKAKRLKGLRKKKKSLPGNISDEFTRRFQKNIKDSPMWDEMVEEFGEKRAEEILKECKAEIKPGLPPGME